jgi:hypothetical protein
VARSQVAASLDDAIRHPGTFYLDEDSGVYITSAFEFDKWVSHEHPKLSSQMQRYTEACGTIRRNKTVRASDDRGRKQSATMLVIPASLLDTFEHVDDASVTADEEI